MKISAGAKKLYEVLPPECWMTEKNLAKAINCRATSIKSYKEELERAGLINIFLHPNGRRDNAKHEIIKFSKVKRSPICKHIFRGCGFGEWGGLSRNELVECYLRSRWEILPFAPRSKRPIKGFSLNWWRRLAAAEKFDYFYENPDLNVGLSICSHLTVIDIDAKNNFWIEDEAFQNTLTVSTARGFHFYFRKDSIITTSTKILPDIDTRCESSFVLLPPSVHPSGELYKWESIAKPQILPIEFRRQWRQRKFELRNKDENFSVSSLKITQGERNDTLWRYGRSLRAKGKNPYEIELELNKYNRSNCLPPLPGAEMQSLIENVCSRSNRADFR